MGIVSATLIILKTYQRDILNLLHHKVCVPRSHGPPSTAQHLPWSILRHRRKDDLQRAWTEFFCRNKHRWDVRVLACQRVAHRPLPWIFTSDYLATNLLHSPGITQLLREDFVRQVSSKSRTATHGTDMATGTWIPDESIALVAAVDTYTCDQCHVATTKLKFSSPRLWNQPPIPFEHTLQT